LEQGEIVERGTHSQLLARNGRYFDLYTRQAGLEANRFINPGEKEPELEGEPTVRSNESTGTAEVAGDLLGISSRSPQA
jgi:hypothetical protein